MSVSARFAGEDRHFSKELCCEIFVSFLAVRVKKQRTYTSVGIIGDSSFGSETARFSYRIGNTN